MSQVPRQNKYDDLLKQFLKSNNSIEEGESERMKRWLDEAADSVRNQFQNHRGKKTNEIILIGINYMHNFSGNVEHITSIEDKSKLWCNDTNGLEAAMCVSLPSDSSDEELHEGNEVELIPCHFNKIFEQCCFYYRQRNVHATAIVPA